MAQRLAVVANETLEREREQPVHAGVYELSRLAGLLAEELRQRAVRPDVFAPDDRVADHCDVRRCDSLKPPFVEPVILAQGVWDSVIGTSVEALGFLPQPWRSQHHDRNECRHSKPLPRA